MPEKHPNQIANVLLPIPVDEPFSYAIPEEFADLIAPGVQVIVPVGERFSQGIVFGIDTPENSERKLKSIEDVIDPDPFVGDDLLKLIHWISEYYICHLGEALRLLNTAVNLEKSAFELRKIDGAPPEKLTALQQQVFEKLVGDAWFSVKDIEKLLGRTNLLHTVHKLRRIGAVVTRYTPPQLKKIYKTIDFFRLLPAADWSESAKKKYAGETTRRSKAHDLIDFLSEGNFVDRSELREVGFDSTIIKKLTDEGVLDREEREIFRAQVQHFQEDIKSVELSDEQQEFVSDAEPFLGESHKFQPFLLHGITGSGKTQIYIELIRRALAAGQDAIVLIPEIVLTPQTVGRFSHYFGDDVAAIHSRISPGEKTEVLQKCREGKVRVIIGPRSAVFAPFKNLGIIIVDEEHESSYKQSDATPRYNARDVALYRAFLNNIPIVLGSATPSLESLFNAKSEKYRYFHLSKRISQRNLPRTQVVDIKEQWFKGGELPLYSDTLLLKMEAKVLSREQAIILQNRRGYSPYILCQECGHVEKCPNCDITLTYHNFGKDLRCHYCGYSQPAPSFCPNCRGMEILYKGVGTQRVEEETIARFPHAKMLRMDQDTTRRKDDHAKILESFRNHEADFLIGTKMIAKGLDFERVTLVGVVNADQGLNFPDFRAVEKTFQLLVQASGRSGRGANSGEVVIQTFDPQHYIYPFLLTHDYLKFYEREIASRKALKYPPFSRLCLIRVIGDDEGAVLHYSQEIAKYLWRCNEQKRYQVLGPAPAPLAKINNQYRYHVLLKQPRENDPSMSYLRKVVKQGIYKNPDLKKWPVAVQIDVDPLDIL